MQKDDQGVWTVNTPPLSPDYYGYSFIVDGVRSLDPNNSGLVPNLISPGNFVHVSGPAVAAVGTERRAARRDSPSFLQVRGRRMMSATSTSTRPRATIRTRKTTYPVLYLLHGYSDDASGWTAVGRANIILDNLIAQGKAKPMIVVMPLGYGTMEIITLGWGAWSHTDVRDKNFSNFRQALLTEVMPKVESEYRVTKDRNSRAIAGLSMGGSESLLNRPEQSRQICMGRRLQCGRTCRIRLRRISPCLTPRQISN